MHTVAQESPDVDMGGSSGTYWPVIQTRLDLGWPLTFGFQGSEVMCVRVHAHSHTHTTATREQEQCDTEAPVKGDTDQELGTRLVAKALPSFLVYWGDGGDSGNVSVAIRMGESRRV